MNGKEKMSLLGREMMSLSEKKIDEIMREAFPDGKLEGSEPITYEELKTVSAYACYVGMVHMLNLLTTQDNTNLWIYTNKELPKESGFYLVTCDPLFEDCHRYVSLYSYDTYNNCWFDSLGHTDHHVVAWMPKPTPAEVEE